MKITKKFLVVVVLAVMLSLGSWAVSLPAKALTPLSIFDLSYRDCPQEIGAGTVTSGGASLPVNCFIVFGKVQNKSGKTVVDADVFGRIYDANHNSVFENRGRVGTILEVPPGVSDFEIRISVPASQPTPLQLEQFKASGFTYRVRPFYYED